MYYIKLDTKHTCTQAFIKDSNASQVIRNTILLHCRLPSVRYALYMYITACKLSEESFIRGKLGEAPEHNRGEKPKRLILVTTITRIFCEHNMNASLAPSKVFRNLKKESSKNGFLIYSGFNKSYRSI